MKSFKKPVFYLIWIGLSFIAGEIGILLNLSLSFHWIDYLLPVALLCSSVVALFLLANGKSAFSSKLLYGWTIAMTVALIAANVFSILADGSPVLLYRSRAIWLLIPILVMLLLGLTLIYAQTVKGRKAASSNKFLS